MARGTKEVDFEKHIEDRLVSKPIVSYGGKQLPLYEYNSIPNTAYKKELAIIPDEVIAFLRGTQPVEFDKMVVNAGSEQLAINSIVARLDSELRYGTLALLRKPDNKFDAGYGAKFSMSFRKPESDKTPEAENLYHRNRLAIVRQLKYSKKNENSIDTVIFLNGLPIVTIELKNTNSGQTHHNAIKQYMEDRPVDGEKLFEFKRCLVHFAVGTEQVFMTTRLNGRKTRFFPFNKTLENRETKSPTGGYKTDYLWEDILRRDSLMNLIHNYIGLQYTEEKSFDRKTKDLKIEKSEALIFPRYHQRRAVERLLDDVKQKGTG